MGHADRIGAFVMEAVEDQRALLIHGSKERIMDTAEVRLAIAVGETAEVVRFVALVNSLDSSALDNHN